MRFLKYFFIIVLILLIASPFVLIYFGVQNEPLVVQGRQLNVEDMNRAKRIWVENDPRKIKPGEIKTMYLTENDLNLALNYASTQFLENRINGRIDVYPNVAVGLITIDIPESKIGRYLNITFTLAEADSLVEITDIKIGSIPVPGWIIRQIWQRAEISAEDKAEFQNFIEALKAIQKIRFYDDALDVTYKWKAEFYQKLQAQGRNFIFSSEEQRLLGVYHQEIIEISYELGQRKSSLAHFIRPLFRFAKSRSRSGQNPVDENRAAIIALTAYTLGKDLNTLLGNPDAASARKPKSVVLSLRDRNDLAKHFMVSAAISVAGGTGLANVAGVFKELEDSRGGSGFSFADLAADHAGVRLGELILASSSDAEFVQSILSKTRNEDDFMPRVDNLPEGLQEYEFKKTYENIDSETYKLMENEIDRRILGCRLFQ